MIRRHFITGEWEEVPDGLGGRYVYRDGEVVPANGSLRETSSCGAISSKRPWKSRSLGVHPDNAAEYQQELRRAGVHATVGTDGHPTVYSRGDRNRLMAFHSRVSGDNIIDRDGGYGDRT